MAPKLTLDASSGAAGPHGSGPQPTSALRAPVARSHTPPPPARPESPGPLSARGSVGVTCAAVPVARQGGWHQSGLPRSPSRDLLAATGAHGGQVVASTSAGDLATVEAVTSSPVAGVLGLSGASKDHGGQWDLLARRLTKQLGLNHDKLTTSERARVFQYYLPTYLWVLRQLEAHQKQHAGAGEPPALVVGISAPQGCGKTTLVASLQHLLNADGHACASVSIDDFYLRGSQQDEVAAKHGDNPLLQFRGNPGTHDLDLAEQTLETLRTLTGAGATARVPTYDKSLRAGRGDRAPEGSWPVVTAPMRVVLLEGWCLGFGAAPEDGAAAAVHPGLGAVNAALRDYASRLERFCDAWIVIRVEDPTWVFDWRLQAERQMRATGKPGLSDDQIRDFCERFQPAYRAYLPGLYGKGPTGKGGAPRLCLDVDSGRTLVGASSS